MHIGTPPGIERLIAAALCAIRAGGDWDMHALYTLELIPELVHEPAVKGSLLQLVVHPWPAVRLSVGRSLALAGYREGLLCLTRCALATHPVLKRSQRGEQDSNIRTLAKQYLIPFAPMLDDDLVGLIVEDLKDPRGNSHFDILSAVPAERSSAKLEAFLASRDERLRAVAAFVLGRLGRQDVRPALEREIGKQRHIELALLALSHIPDARVMELLEYFENRDNAPYREWNTDARRTRLAMLARRRRFLLSCASTPKEALSRFFRKEYPEYARDSTPVRLYHLGRRWEGPEYDKDENTESTADFIAEFLSADERAACAAEQLEAMKTVKSSPAFQPRDPNRIFDFLAGPLREPKGKFLPGVTLFFDHPDYDFAATDWIRNAERYRVGTLSEF